MTEHIPGAAVVVTRDVAYRTVDGRTLTGELYRPDNMDAAPVVIAIHGGGWQNGSPDRYAYWGRWLAERGIAVFAIRYRLANATTHFPDPLVDVREAIRFVGGHAAELKLDAGRVALMGDSAGAHLAAMAALTQTGASSAHGVKAAILVYGVFDLLQQWEHDQIARPRDQITEKLLGFSPLDDRLSYCAASPMFHATTSAPRVPYLVSWGTDDDLVDHEAQSKRFVTALKQSGLTVRTVAVTDAPHFWVGQPIDEPHSFTGFLAPNLLRFLREQFKS